MELTKAIEILNDWGILSAHEVDLDLRNAVKLGTQALRRTQNARICGDTKWISPLPGETEAKHD